MEQIVLVTGAKGGLGQFVTEAFLGEGATVVGVARSISQADFANERFVAQAADLGREDGARAAVDAVLARFGRVDVLVNVLGGFDGGKALPETDISTFEKMFALNFWPAVYMTRLLIPGMRAAGFGRVIGIGSRTAVSPVATLSAYSASKAAMVSLFQTLALENKDAGITVNTVLPGTIDTPANRKTMPNADFSRWVNPANLASLILWLASDAAANVTGANIPVYGKDA
jgi:NAD(P)-dependent dehydrogenase (short-subunit alcohol dehydrogenase family)